MIGPGTRGSGPIARIAEQLERLARIWKTSKSAALRRALSMAASATRELSGRSTRAQRQAEADRGLAALRRYQESVTLSEPEAEEWVRQIREDRRAWTRHRGL